jgi:PBSX family phage terminase large subunit
MQNIFGEAGVKYSTSKKEATIAGRTVDLEGGDNELAHTKIQGMTLAGALFNELTLIPESMFTQCLGRMSVERAKLFATTNPDSPYHWLKKNYLDRENELDLRQWKFKLSDNPHLPKEYVNSLKQEYTGLWYDRFIESLWTAAEGIVYDMFDPKRHVVSELPKMQRYFIGIDYGTSNPTVFLLIGQAYDGKLYVCKEWSHEGGKGNTKTDTEYVKHLKEFLPNNYNNICVDPSAASFIAAARKANISGLRKANNTVLDGIRSVASLLANDLLFYHESCEGLIGEKTRYSWDKRAQQRGEDKPLKENDHYCDAERYGIFTNRSYWHAMLEQKSGIIDRLAGARRN